MKNKNTAHASDKYKEVISKLNESIKDQQERQNKFISYSKEYRVALSEEIKLQQEKLELTKKQADALEKSIQEYKE